MKITTRLTISAVMPALVAVAIGLTQLWNYRVTMKLMDEMEVTRQIGYEVYEWNRLIPQYLLHHGESRKRQFVIVHENLVDLFSNLRYGPERKELFEDLQVKITDTVQLFHRLVTSERIATDVAREAEKRLAGQLLDCAYDALLIVQQLENLIDEEFLDVQRWRRFIILGLAVGLAVLLTVVLLSSISGLSKTLAQLERSAEIVGDGDLDHRTGIEADDEIGNLAKTFDAMTARLQTTTVSRDSLAVEVAVRREAEEQIRKKSEALAIANNELEAFSYSVSHDLRAPLRSIIGFSSLLRNHADQLDEKANEYLQRITAGAAKMNVLIDDMLRLSSISKQEMVIQEIDLSPMAKAIIRELELQYPERHVEIHITDNLRALGDAQLINIVLTNLFGNAWKYTGKTAEAYIEFGSCQKKGKRVFFIRDNGAGFPMEQADRLFKPFQRLHSESEFTGTGVGLPIVERVIKRHGGEIWAEGGVGKGSVFYFTLGS